MVCGRERADPAGGVRRLTSVMGGATAGNLQTLADL
jgi:hypothetical protein